MEKTRKIDVLFGVVVIAFLIATIIVIKDIRVIRANDYKQYSASLSTIIKNNNVKIRALANQLAEAQKENTDLKNTLAQTRNDLDALSKKLAGPAPAAAK